VPCRAAQVLRLAKAAPEPFHFRLYHPKLQLVQGVVFYLPVIDGEETISRIMLHEGSRCCCFWKGRLMPYAKAPADGMLPFMDWTADATQKAVKTRTVLMLFFGAIAEVDHIKFKFVTDIGKALREELTTFEQWRSSGGQWAISQPRAIKADFKAWCLRMHEAHDKMTAVEEPLPADEARRLGAAGGAFAKLTYGQEVFRRGDVVKVTVKSQSSFDGGPNVRQHIARISHFTRESGAGPSQGATEFGATAQVHYERLPAELYAGVTSCNPDGLIKCNEADRRAHLTKERKKAPVRLVAKFDDEDGPPGTQHNTGRTRGAGPSHNIREFRSGDALPQVIVQPFNHDGERVYNWRVKGAASHKLRVKQAFIFKSEDSDTAVAWGTPAVSQDTHGDLPGEEGRWFCFNAATRPLRFGKAGEYTLRYELEPLPVPVAQQVIVDPSTEQTQSWKHGAPFAELRVRVVAGVAVGLSCMVEGAADGINHLGAECVIRSSFVDDKEGSDGANVCVLEKSQLESILKKQHDAPKDSAPYFKDANADLESKSITDGVRFQVCQPR
jgi:hypothetical protein